MLTFVVQPPGPKHALAWHVLSGCHKAMVQLAISCRGIGHNNPRERNNRMNVIEAEPFPLEFEPTTTALVIIDMQRDFVLPGGFGEKLGNDTSLLLAAVQPTERVLARAREKGMLVVHTREGHRPDLTDCPPAKLTRGGKTFIGAPGPMGRILVRGEQGHDIIN